MRSTFPRQSRALLAAATLAMSAAVAGPALAAPRPPRDDEVSGKPAPAIPTFQDPDVAVDLQVLALCPTPEQLKALTDKPAAG